MHACTLGTNDVGRSDSLRSCDRSPCTAPVEIQREREAGRKRAQREKNEDNSDRSHISPSLTSVGTFVVLLFSYLVRHREVEGSRDGGAGLGRGRARRWRERERERREKERGGREAAHRHSKGVGYFGLLHFCRMRAYQICSPSSPLLSPLSSASDSRQILRRGSHKLNYLNQY